MFETLTDMWLSVALWNGLFIALGVFGAAIVRAHFRLNWFLLSLLLLNIYFLLLLDPAKITPIILGWIGDPELQFNWVGKAMGVLGSILMILLLRLPRQEMGITFKQAPKAWIGWIVLLGLILFDVYLALQEANTPQTANGIAYQLTMPSLDEELFYRGILLYTLVKSFGDGPRILFANFGWAALMSTIIFGFVHGLFWADGGVTFIWGNIIFAGVIGLLLMWLRLNTGSIVAPIILHSVVNTLWRII